MWQKVETSGDRWKAEKNVLFFPYMHLSLALV